MHTKQMFFIFILECCLLLACPGYSQEVGATETAQLPSKLQIAIEPEEIILTKGITVGATDRKIQLIIRETSSLKRAELELVARPFTDITSGDIVDVSTVMVGIAKQQVALTPGGLQRVDLTIGGFQQAGTYLGGLTIHDTVSGERKDVNIRVSVKASWELPVVVLLGSVLLTSGVNHWAKKGRHKNRLDQRVEELHKTIKLAGNEADPFLVEAERFLEKARQYNQEFQFEHTEAALRGVGHKLAEYEHRKQGAEELRAKIQDLLNEVQTLGESDPQNSRLNSELIQLLPKIESDYEETEAIFKQIEIFFQAYRLARRDLQTAREKLFSSLEYVKKADKSKTELILSEIDRILMSAESMSALDETNALLRKAAFELSPEKINENMFRSQRLQKVLDDYQQHVKQVTGAQVGQIVSNWYQKAQQALEDNRYEDVDDALHKLDKTLTIIEKIKQAEKRIKGRDKKMTELRRMIRDCKNFLEGASWDAIHRAEWDVNQVIEMLDGIRKQYEPFHPITHQETPNEESSDEERTEQTLRPESTQTQEQSSTKLRPLTHEDLLRNLEKLLEEAAQYPKLGGKIAQWRDYCHNLLKFDELNETFEYLRLIQDQLVLFVRIQELREQAESRHLHAVLRLSEQAEQLLLNETQEERGLYNRAEVLSDAASALLEEKQKSGDLDQMISYIRKPRTVSKIVTYGSLVIYFSAAIALGFQILYAPSPDFGSIVFEDYFSLVLWALGLEGVRMTAANVYEAYFKKEA
ncbi:ATPase involved in DNA repair [Candidatus Vecturithrix granuli]|uniref:ATPase involved in DNA repair n=1 Tax=Vecturithrix granuli TaxID=1499967 RepID=A0A081BYG2_VECG1|nr:ATPase involved in DNA repair [Candidatus Vecturithrix granuli]